MSGDGAESTSGDRVWLAVPYGEKDEAKALGAGWDQPSQRWYARPDRVAQLQRCVALPLPELLPGEDHSFGCGLFVDLVATSGCFTNVRTFVCRGLGRVKVLVVGRAGQRCEACGRPSEPSRGLWLEANERWSYDETTRVQSLRRLVCLCTWCHHTTHFGHAEVTSRAVQA
jgi:hypothetical protein